MRPHHVSLTERIPAGLPYSARRGFLPHGYTSVRPDEYISREFWEITAITSGEGRNEIIGRDGRIARIESIRAGEIFLWGPHDRNVPVPGVNGMTFCQVCFPAADWHDFTALMRLDFSPATSGEPFVVRFEPHDTAATAPFDDAIAALAGDPTMFDLVGFWLATIPAFLAAAGPTPRTGTPAWLVSAIDAMQTEENLRAGMPRLLELARVTHGHLARVTKRYLLMTPIQLVTGMRIRYATRLLATTPDSVAIVAGRSGFEDATYFARRFRRSMGMSPREFRIRSRSGTLPY